MSGGWSDGKGDRELQVGSRLSAQPDVGLSPHDP